MVKPYNYKDELQWCQNTHNIRTHIVMLYVIKIAPKEVLLHKRYHI